MPPTDRFVISFAAEPPQETLPYGRWANTLAEHFRSACEQIDASITEGPGLRWAFHGPMLTFHLAGGPGGMAHMLDHFGAALLEPWTRLEAPALTPQLRERMVDGCLREAAGRSVAELERLRDEFLAELIPLVERYSAGGL